MSHMPSQRAGLLRRLIRAGKGAAPDEGDAADMGTAFGLDFSLDQERSAHPNAAGLSTSRAGEAAAASAGAITAQAAGPAKRSRWRRGG
jgi:hypothetical protein